MSFAVHQTQIGLGKGMSLFRSKCLQLRRSLVVLGNSFSFFVHRTQIELGKGLSPSIQISNIPAGTVKLLVNFTDLDYGDEGGHGGFEVKVSGENSIVFPSMEGGTPLLTSFLQKRYHLPETIYRF